MNYSNQIMILIPLFLITIEFFMAKFIQLLHEYRSKRVNAANLELEQLFNLEKLYTYLRNHHWKDGIATEFLQEWVQMNISKYKLLKTDNDDFHSIFQKLNIPN